MDAFNFIVESDAVDDYPMNNSQRRDEFLGSVSLMVDESGIKEDEVNNAKRKGARELYTSVI